MTAPHAINAMHMPCQLSQAGKIHMTFVANPFIPKQSCPANQKIDCRKRLGAGRPHGECKQQRDADSDQVLTMTGRLLDSAQTLHQLLPIVQDAQRSCHFFFHHVTFQRSFMASRKMLYIPNLDDVKIHFCCATWGSKVFTSNPAAKWSGPHQQCHQLPLL